MRRRRLSRSPFVFWLAALALAALTAIVVSRVGAEAGNLARHYGPLRPVVVATRVVEAGAEVTAADVALRDLPTGFRPEAALGSEDEVVGRTAVARLEAGQTVLAPHLAPEGLRGIAAVLPPGTRAVAVPRGGATPPVQRGDVVDVLATLDPALTGGGDPTFPVAVGALVVDAGPDLDTVAVDPEAAMAVAFAVASGSVTLVVSSPVVAAR